MKLPAESNAVVALSYVTLHPDPVLLRQLPEPREKGSAARWDETRREDGMDEPFGAYL